MSAPRSAAVHSKNVGTTRRVIDGWVLSPEAARAEIRTVWFVDQGKEIPRFVTTHPVRRKR